MTHASPFSVTSLDDAMRIVRAYIDEGEPVPRDVAEVLLMIVPDRAALLRAWKAALR